MTALSEAHLVGLTDPATYAAELETLLGQIGTLNGTAETAMIEILDDARLTVLKQINVLDFDSPSRAMLNRALSGVDQTTADFAQKAGKSLAEFQAEGHALGIDLALKPLGGERGFDILGSAVSLDQLQIMQGFSTDLVQGLSTDLRRRITGEITSVVVGAKSPFAAATAIGRNLTDPNHFSSIAHRARAIVVTEVGRANSLGTQQAQNELQRSFFEAGQTDEVKKRWLNGHLPGARITHLEAEARYSKTGAVGPIKVGDVFQIGGFKALYPKDPSLPPSESVHCHCVSLTIIDEGSSEAAESPEATTAAKQNYTAKKAAAAAPGVAKTKKALGAPATKFLDDPYTSAGLKPVKKLKNGTLGYGGKPMAKALGYSDPAKSGFVFNKKLGAFAHKNALSGKQLPAFGKLLPAEQAAVMKSAGLSGVTRNQIVKHLNIKIPKGPVAYATTKPAAAPVPAPKPKPAPKPRTKPKVKTAPVSGSKKPLKPIPKENRAAGTRDRSASASLGDAKSDFQKALRKRMGDFHADIFDPDTANELKAKIMLELGDVLDDVIPADHLADFIDDFPTRFKTRGIPGNLGQQAASDMISSWAATSGDANPGSLLMQRAVAEVFDLPWPPVGYTSVAAKAALGQASALYIEYQDVVDTFVKAMYENTQRQLADLGFGRTIMMARGVDINRNTAKGLGLSGKEKLVKLNPASSFAVSGEVAKGFGNSVMWVEVPIERVLGCSLTGYGCLHELEFVLLGAKKAEQMFVTKASAFG